MKRVHIFISGIVQGVSFRYYARREAVSLGIHGWVRNLYDGRVEAVAEGEPDSVDEFVEWCRHGPPAAKVEKVEVETEEPTGETGFGIRR